jgi:molecular chaperone HtpG
MTTLEKRAEEAEELPAFSGLKLIHIKKKISEILGLVGKYEIFDQYTKHDISHINQLLETAEWLIPDDTKKVLTAADCLMIVLAIYFHDLGMLVTKEEYTNRNKSGFPEYKNQVLSGGFGIEYQEKARMLILANESFAEHFLYQEFVRTRHAERIKFWIQGQQVDELGYAKSIIEEIDSLLSHMPKKFRLDLGIVCESHHLDDLEDFDKYPVSFPYGRKPNEAANIHYAALVLRSVDLLHITSDRTPSIEFRLISPSDPISQLEWIKQMAVSNVRPHPKKDKDGKVDNTLPKDTIAVTAFFDEPEKSDAFFSLMSYLKYVRKQLQQTHAWAELANNEQGTSYSFPWRDINDENVHTQGFERELFQFNLDQNKILNLLVGHTLYNDSTVVLRELIQNSIDAVRLQSYRDGNIREQKIQVNFDSETSFLDIIDTGTGMTRAIIKEHLLKVGSSRYQDEKFKKEHPEFSPISRFGIGVLTCFLISNEIEIYTITAQDSDALNLTIKDVDGKYLLRTSPKKMLPKVINGHGTFIRLKVRPEIEMKKLIDNIRKWVLFPPCSLTVKIDNGEPTQIGYDSPKEALEQYLLALDYNLDNDIKVEQREYNGLTLAFAVQYSKYFSEWQLVVIRSHNPPNIYNPIGTAVEGIRVEFDTPGFKGQRVIALANAQGKKAPKTNVARSTIENSDWLENVYTLYINYVKDEISSLNKNRGFSITWSALEATFLLRPFFETRSNEDKSEIANKWLLGKAINTIDGLLIESSKTRKAVSVDYLDQYSEIHTVDCDLFRSAENMIKEVPTDASLINLLEALYGKDNIDFDVKDLILCGFQPENVLHANAVREREVAGIKLHHSQRRVDLIWKKTNSGIWLDMSRVTDSSRHFGRATNVLIQLKDIKIDDLRGEIAIGAFYKTYLLIGSPFHTYLLSILKQIKYDANPLGIDTAIVGIVIDLGVNFLQGNKTKISEDDINKYMDYRFQSNSSRLFAVDMMDQVFWKKIDKTALYAAMIGTEWKTFDTFAWNRRGHYALSSYFSGF